MTEAQSTEQLRLLQQEIVLAGEAVETLKREQRAAIDALRLEVEMLTFHPISWWSASLLIEIPRR